MTDDLSALSSVDLRVAAVADHVALVELTRPPHNYFDIALLEDLGRVYRAIDDGGEVRAIVLAAEGKNFCAGADFVGASAASTFDAQEGARRLYAAAHALFLVRTPVVAAVLGAAVGGGLGLALSADLRVASESSRFSANFVRIGLHCGFGISVTLPRAVGDQHATDLLLTGRSVRGAEAHRIGLCDRLVADDDVRGAAIALAGEIAQAAPFAVSSTRATLRTGLADAVAAAVERERLEQAWLRDTADFAEGVRASAERRAPRFSGA